MEIGAIEDIYPCEERKQEEETLNRKLTTLKPQVISSLINQTYLSTLHKKLAVLAESLNNLDSLYSYHPSTDLNFNTKKPSPSKSPPGTLNIVIAIPVNAN